MTGPAAAAPSSLCSPRLFLSQRERMSAKLTGEGEFPTPVLPRRGVPCAPLQRLPCKGSCHLPSHARQTTEGSPRSPAPCHPEHPDAREASRRAGSIPTRGKRATLQACLRRSKLVCDAPSLSATFQACSEKDLAPGAGPLPRPEMGVDLCSWIR